MESRAAPVSLVAPSRPAEKAGLLAALALYTIGGYYLVGLNVTPDPALDMEMAVDGWFPARPEWMYVYAAVYTSLLYPIFVVRCQTLFRRVCVGYLLVASGCLVGFVLLPATVEGYRVDVATLDMGVLHEWGMRLNYYLDPATNLCPSLHVAVAFLAGLCAWQARPLFGLLGLLGAALVAVSVLYVKQHYAIDAISGAVLGVAAWAVAVRGYRPGPEPAQPIAYSWRGPAWYLLLYALSIGGLAVAWALGWEPWA